MNKLDGFLTDAEWEQSRERALAKVTQPPKWAREFAEQEDVRRAQANYDRPPSVTESYNLQEALKTIINRYGLNEVKEALSRMSLGELNDCETKIQREVQRLRPLLCG